MVEEVEHIIRSIEDEKTAVEERVKTRDVFARIEGLEREKVRFPLRSPSLTSCLLELMVSPPFSIQSRCSSPPNQAVSSSTKSRAESMEPRSQLKPPRVDRLPFPSRRRRVSGDSVISSNPTSEGTMICGSCEFEESLSRSVASHG